MKNRILALSLCATLVLTSALLVKATLESNRLRATVRQQQAVIEKQRRELQAYHKGFEYLFSEYDLLLRKYLWLESKTKKA